MLRYQILRKSCYLAFLSSVVFISSVSNLPTEDRTCPSDHFMCNNQHCIPKAWLCDGEYDCERNGDGDRSDEVDCPPISCGPKEFLCPEGQCIQRSWVCDNDEDCKNGNDEQNCASIPCSPSEFKCGNGICIRNAWVCDGSNDCADGSDETEQECSKSQCNSTTQFRCEIGECIPSAWVCDGSKDCKSGIDEEKCEGPVRCTKEEFLCVQTGLCISQRKVCNGVKDCSDGSDESVSYCVHRAVTCQPNQFKCRSSYCISESWRCDGDKDCDDGSDEQNCPSYTTKMNESATITMTTSSAPTRAIEPLQITTPKTTTTAVTESISTLKKSPRAATTTNSPTSQTTEPRQMTTPQTTIAKRRPVIASMRTRQTESSTAATTTDSVLAVENITPIISPSDGGLLFVRDGTTAAITSTSSPQGKTTLAATSKQLPNTQISTSQSKSTKRRRITLTPLSTRVIKNSRIPEGFLTTIRTTDRPRRKSTQAKIPTSTSKSTPVPTRKRTTKAIVTAKRSTPPSTTTKKHILTARRTTVRSVRRPTVPAATTSLVRLLTTKPTKKLTTRSATAAKSSTATIGTTKMILPITPIPKQKTQTPPLCGGLLTSNSGIITSPNHPRPYPNNAYCKWIIHLPKVFHVITFHIEELFLELDHNCAYDYLMFLDELHNQIGCRHCGSLMYPKVVDVKGHIAMVVFRSDHFNGKRGFRLRYSAFWNY